jgi:hypothetical protein
MHLFISWFYSCVVRISTQKLFFQFISIVVNKLVIEIKVAGTHGATETKFPIWITLAVKDPFN